MWPKVVALVLLLLGVALGVVGNWLKPPAKIGGRTIVAIFTVLLLLAGGITFVNTASSKGASGTPQASGGASAGAAAPSVRTSKTSAAPTSTRSVPTSSGPPRAGVNDPTHQTAPTHKPATRSQPCIVGSWTLTTIVDYIPYADQTVTMSYDSGWETRTYKADGTFAISNDWRERGYDNTLNELTTHSNGTAEGHYRLHGSTSTYDPVSSTGNWILSVNGQVSRQSSVIFSRGEETVSCSSSSLKVVSGSDYKASYKRR